MSKTILLTIKNIDINTEDKVATVLKILSKASNRVIEMDNHDHSVSEPTPYGCLQELANVIYDDAKTKLWGLYSQIISKWVQEDLQKASTDNYKLNGKIFLNPKTGKHLTQKEWSEIKKDLTRIFNWVYKDSEEALLKQAMAMGKILSSMIPEDRIKVGLTDLDLPSAMKALDKDTQYKYIADAAEVLTGDLIQDVSERSRKSIVKVIMNGYNDRITQKELEDRLFEEFDVMNRDWRRIAETETATNFNNGYLIGELKENSDDERPIFMQGISGGGACSFCASEVNDQIFVLLPEANGNGDDTVVVDNESYTAIWPGKTNYGRKRAQWWVAAGTQHPHCRCTFIRIGDMTDDFERQLRTAMNT